jgi:UDP-N-acetylglucosamine 2-epimerase
MLIDIIAGARPNFMKVAPIIRALEARKAAGGPLRYRLVEPQPYLEFNYLVKHANALIGTDPAKLAPALDRLFAGAWPRRAIPELWDLDS